MAVERIAIAVMFLVLAILAVVAVLFLYPDVAGPIIGGAR